MTDANSTSTEQGNKSFDENNKYYDLEITCDNPRDIKLHAKEERNCFNQNCRNDGNEWINIVGRNAGYRDLAVPYWICDECSSYLKSRRALFDQLANKLQPYAKLRKIGIDIKDSDPISGKLIITTKDLDELIFSTQVKLMEEEDDQANKITTCIDREPTKQIGCYNMYCRKEGTHRIDILNSTTLLADHEIPYFICDTCYLFFEYRRKAPLVFDRNTERELSGINPFTGKEVITTTDLHNLLESTKYQGV